jgi:hypothetical protein
VSVDQPKTGIVPMMSTSVLTTLVSHMQVESFICAELYQKEIAPPLGPGVCETTQSGHLVALGASRKLACRLLVGHGCRCTEAWCCETIGYGERGGRSVAEGAWETRMEGTTRSRR